jgi:hypothetical protein
MPPESVEATDHLQVLAPGERFVDRRILPGEADDLAHGLRVGHHIDAIYPGGAAVGLQQGGEHAHERGLAGAVRAEQAKDRARLDVEVDAIEGFGRAERLLDPSNFDDRICHASSVSTDFARQT